MRIKAKRNLLYKGEIIQAGEEATVEAKAGKDAVRLGLGTEVQAEPTHRKTAKEAPTEPKAE